MTAGRADGTILRMTGTTYSLPQSEQPLTRSRAIILLGPHLSRLRYIDIDTSHFSGNEAPASSVFALRLNLPNSGEIKLRSTDARWEEILPIVDLGPNRRHVFELGRKANDGLWSAVMVRMIPDGGIVFFAPITSSDPLIRDRLAFEHMGFPSLPRLFQVRHYPRPSRSISFPLFFLRASSRALMPTFLHPKTCCGRVAAWT